MSDKIYFLSYKQINFALDEEKWKQSMTKIE